MNPRRRKLAEPLPKVLDLMEALKASLAKVEKPPQVNTLNVLKQRIRDNPGVLTPEPNPDFVPKNKLCEECDTYIPVDDYQAHVLDTHCTRVGCSRTSLAVGDHHPKHCPLAQPF